MQTPSDGSFFECSAQPIVSLATNELTRRGFLAFCRDSATLRNLFFRMKPPLRSLFASLAVVLAAALTAAPLLAKSDAGNVTTSVGRLLEEGHYTHQPLNDEVITQGDPNGPEPLHIGGWTLPVRPSIARRRSGSTTSSRRSACRVRRTRRRLRRITARPGSRARATGSSSRTAR